jgi:hypothetical protein
VCTGIKAQPLACRAWLCSGLSGFSGSSQRARGADAGDGFTVWPHIQMKHVKQPLCQHEKYLKVILKTKKEYFLTFNVQPKARHVQTKD